MQCSLTESNEFYQKKTSVYYNVIKSLKWLNKNFGWFKMFNIKWNVYFVIITKINLRYNKYRLIVHKINSA